MKTTFGFLGTFGPWHGVEVLQELIPQVIEQNKDVHFLLMGEGSGRSALEEKVRQQGLMPYVTFTGRILPNIVPSYLAQCDAFLCPTQANTDGSRFFGSPTKLFEYLSMARPIIASDLEQVAEIVSPAFSLAQIRTGIPPGTDEVGILVSSRDVQEFVDACLYVASMSEHERKKMGKNARRKALDHYTWRSHVQKIVDHSQLL